MSIITDIAVTYTLAPPDDAYEQIAKLPTPCFIWAKREPGEQGITDLAIVSDDEMPLDGFVKLPQDLNQGQSGQSLYLWVRKAEGVPPLVEVKVVS